MAFVSQTQRAGWLQAEQAKAAGADATAAIRRRGDLSSEGRKRQLARVHTVVRNRLAEIRQQDRDAIIERQDTLIRSLFSPSRYATSEAARALERDAARTAAGITSPGQARQLLADADALDDHSLARAVARRASQLYDQATPGLDQQPWADVIDMWAGSPAAPAAARDTIAILGHIGVEAEDAMGRFAADEHYRPPTPPELRGTNAATIARWAAEADETSDLRPPSSAEQAGQRMASFVHGEVE